MASPEDFLNSILKMTPGRRGIWKDIQAITDPDKADFIFVMDRWEKPIPLDRTIFFAEHPKCLQCYTDYKGMKGKALLALPLDRFLNPGEWWIDHDYDYLSKLENPIKSKKAMCCFTAKVSPYYPKMYSDRLRFVEQLVGKTKEVDIYGRPEHNFLRNPILSPIYKGVMGKVHPNGMKGEHQSGKEGLIDYKYSFEFDNGPSVNYFSERFYDSMLMWAMPIYYGSSNVHEHLPANSFRYVDLDNYDESESDKAITIINSTFREDHIQELTEARDLLLNKYQMWAYMYDVIHNLDAYRKKWMSN